MRPRLAAIAIVLPAALLGAGCVIGDLALTARTKSVEQRPIDRDGTFHLKNVNGKVEIATWDQPSVRIEADKAATSQDALEAVEVRITGQGSRVDVDTRFPRRGPFGSPAKVDYRVSLPPGVRIEIETVNGAVTVRKAAGGVRATTVNGSVTVDDAAGDVELSAVNGSVQAKVSSPDSRGRHELATTNGSVTLQVPNGVQGQFEAQTVNGGIHCDLPFKVQGKFGPKHLKGSLGDGIGRFDLKTVNGSVTIKTI